MNVDTSPAGCARCSDPLAVSLHSQPLRRIDQNIWIFQCPDCGTLILDDILGWKGSGVIFRATEAMIDQYVRKYGQPDPRPPDGKQ